MAATQKDLEPLEHLQKRWGGRFYSEKGGYISRWEVSGLQAFQFTKDIWPWLSKRRRNQILKGLFPWYQRHRHLFEAA